MHATSAATVAAVTAAFPLRWHDCWCPDFFLRHAFHVDYCPTHGFPWRAETELQLPLTHCGCQDCQDNLDSFLTAFAEGILHDRKTGFIDDDARVPVLAVRG